ncbi:hypothetical protein Hypma_015277 [Hypsizygus marmoreus]|uniref:Nucleolar 27S pre-rRNA processing Urb2/Npa2 C-terminal domain-containing protein n=1 Tax=Hypsizygus marmoreus TaxID=39966 RepID=A0A369KCX2_HYPMA|nr:hypothetical protein Hypma_015277 [Hypsizygus marmoreus]
MASTHSSQAFVRTLKAATDPPTPDGPPKIEIARKSWDDTSFYVPSKAEVIVDWILTKLLKEKANKPSLNPILDLRIWELLHDVISSSDTALLRTNTRPLKAWLPMLLNRIPFAPILLSLLDLVSSLDSETRHGLTGVVSSCLEDIWPLAVQKTSTETIMECFGAFVRICGLCEIDTGLARIGMIITASFRNSVSNSSNKKKIYSTFLQSHFHYWLQCVILHHPQEPLRLLLDAIYDAGAETIFNVDILRQIQDSNTEIALLEAVACAVSSHTSIVAVLPRLFSSYIEAIKKHRGALFSQGSNQLPGSATEELCSTGMQFFAVCESLLGRMEQNAHAWAARVALLSLVDQERLFHQKQPSAELALNRIVNEALAALDQSHGESDLIAHAVECLSALARIDYDLVIPALPRILPKILMTQESTPAYLTFLDLFLAYHTKTRTLNKYLASLYTAFIPQAAISTVEIHDRYHIAFSGPLFDSVHLEHLSKAIGSFLPGTQAQQTIESVFGSLNAAWGHFDDAGGKAEDDEGPRKKRRVMEDPERDSWAITFSLSAQMSATVLSSLPLHSISEATRGEVECQLSDIQKTTRRAAKKAFKKMRGKNSITTWPLSIIAAASLRLQYALDTSGLTPSSVDAKLYSSMYNSLQDDVQLPELSIEILRTLLHLAPFHDQAVTRAVLDHLLAFLEKNFTNSDSSWAGRPHGLALDKQGRRECALALMHMVVQRWLPLLESIASREQLETFIRIFISVNIPDMQESPISSGLQAQPLLLQTLHSAQFWELPNLRTVFLAYLDQAIPVLDIDTLDTSEPVICNMAASYRLLLLLPAEYLSRSSRIEFIRRALLADRFIGRLPDSFSSKYEYLTILRVSLRRAFSYIHHGDLTVQSIGETLGHLTSLDQSPPRAQENFLSATIDLVDSLFSALFKFSDRSGITTILDWVHGYEETGLETNQPETINIRLLSITRMIETLNEQFSFVTFPQEVQSGMLELHRYLWKTIYPEALILGMEGSSVQIHLLTLWCSLLTFGKWLGLTNADIPHVGKHLTIKMIQLPRPNRADTEDEIRVTTLSILFQELHYYHGESRLSHLDLILAAYLSFSGSLSLTGCQQVDGHLSKTCKDLSVSEFTHVLEVISESLENTTSQSPEVCTRLVQLSAVLMREHPQGALKPMQNFSSQLINVFAGWNWLIDGPVELRVQTLGFLVQHCAERPAVLRLLDIGNIWTLLSRFLAGSRAHDDCTTSDILHKIVAVISALVRLRRDLVVLTLPHLGCVLRQLMMSFRSVRPHLGAKQTALVTDTQPRWINPKQPIGAEEAKALGRLLEALTVKSMVRNHTSSTETQKAESLAKPLSKHSAFIIKAYIDAMNDPLCLLSSEIRKELQRGLYAVCSMVGDHNRDAMMVAALDAGGKSTMKTLWKEYEKQRYVGKG